MLRRPATYCFEIAVISPRRLQAQGRSDWQIAEQARAGLWAARAPMERDRVTHSRRTPVPL